MGHGNCDTDLKHEAKADVPPSSQWRQFFQILARPGPLPEVLVQPASVCVGVGDGVIKFWKSFPQATDTHALL